MNNQLVNNGEIYDLAWQLVGDKTVDEAFPILRDRVGPAVEDSRIRGHLETAHAIRHMEPAPKPTEAKPAEPPVPVLPAAVAGPAPPPAPEPPKPALVAAPAPAATVTAESFEDIIWNAIVGQMGDESEPINVEAIECIFDFDLDSVTFPDGMGRADVVKLIRKLDAERRGVEDKPRPKPNGKPRKRVDRRVPGFRVDNSTEMWIHCKPPFLRFMVSNHRRVAWAVDAGHGAYRGKILTPRRQLVWANGKPVAITCVRLYDDEGRRVERNVEFIYQNAAGQPKR